MPELAIYFTIVLASIAVALSVVAVGHGMWRLQIIKALDQFPGLQIKDQNS